MYKLIFTSIAKLNCTHTDRQCTPRDTFTQVWESLD